VDAICTRSAFVNNLFSACRQASDFTQDTCNTQQDRLIAFNDPLIHSQEWFLNMMKVPEAWKLGYTGKNVRVRINDSGIDALHEEFKGRFDRLASCSKYIASDSNHGTSVASIVGAAADNGECGVGIAPNVVLSSCNIFQEDGDAFLGDDKLSRYDISQNSFGYPSKYYFCSRLRNWKAFPW
jgi:subtilisin family serine protease